ncbi:MAG: NAD(P)/FAD-dependent oxidoreductase [Casimicrobium sp.]
MKRPHIVIIGCGFGGLEAARALRDAAVDITLIDRTNHHLFQPLLYQIATAGLSAPAIAAPTRFLFRKQRNVTTLLGEVVAIDASARSVQLENGERIDYDHLIVASGATHSYFGNDHWAEFAPGLKTLEDAFEIRRRILLAFEHAEREQDIALREPWLTFAVIGAGPTGVEMAGTLAEIARHTLPEEFRRIDSRNARILLVEGADRVLLAFPPSLSKRAEEQLTELGVEVLTSHKVMNIDAQGIHVNVHGVEQTIICKTVIWAAGVAASPLGKLVATACALPEESVDRAGRIAVEPDLSLAGHPEISVVGDLALAKSHEKDGSTKPVPGVSPGAKQMGRVAAKNILARIAGKSTQAFRYNDYGALATIGRSSAVVDVVLPVVGNVRFGGLIAWLFWLFVHVYFLIGFRNRFVVLMDWGWSYLSFNRTARVVVGTETFEPIDASQKSKH